MKKTILLATLVLAAPQLAPAQAKVKTKTKSAATATISAPAALPSSQSAADPTDWNAHYADQITAERLRTHLTVLASDEYEGRETGEKGQHLAAAYVAQQFKTAGLTGPVAKADDPYLQKFTLEHVAWAATPTLKIGGTTYKWLVDFYGRGDAGFSQETIIQPVFVGYGIEQPGYSDYAGQTVSGKDILLLDGEPTTPGGLPVLNADGSSSSWATDYRTKLNLAMAKGARSVFIVNLSPRSNFDKLIARVGPSVSKPSIMLAGEKPERIPTFFISPTIAYKLLGTDQKTAQGYLDKIALAKQPVSSPFKTHNFTIKAAKVRTPFSTENALGFVEGSDKRSEVLVVSAHHDHLGIVDGKIYNGADDDGSGTSSIITIAEAVGRAKREGHGPRRSILFLSVTGEEEGLFGSEYYAGHPIFPLANTVADLNVDMVGRTDADHEGKPDYVYVIGSDKLSSQLRLVLEEQNNKYEHLDLDYKFDDPNDPNRFYYRSDHYNFAVKKIPVAFFFNGVHDDYHQPTDDIEKIQFDKMEKRARLVFHTAWELANREDRIVVDSNKP